LTFFALGFYEVAYFGSGARFTAERRSVAGTRYTST